MKKRLSRKYTIHHYRELPFNKKELLKEIRFNNAISRATNDKPTQDAPGIQSAILLDTPNFRILKRSVLRKARDLLKPPLGAQIYYEAWAFISDSRNKFSIYHDHAESSRVYLKIDMTWVFYVQVPKDLIGDDGKIFFKTEDAKEHKILPREGDLLCFPARLLHRPETNVRSKDERIVVAGTCTVINTKKVPKRPKRLKSK